MVPGQKKKTSIVKRGELGIGLANAAVGRERDYGEMTGKFLGSFVELSQNAEGCRRSGVLTRKTTSHGSKVGL